MSGFLSETQSILAKRGSVFFARLVDFDAASGHLRAWEGFGPVVVDGETWSGAGQLGGISDLPVDDNDGQGIVTFTISGVSPAVQASIRAHREMRGRPVIIYGRFFDCTPGSATYLQPLDSTITLATLVGDVMGYGASGPASRTVQLTAEPIWSGRNRASYATYSDNDQQERFAGDKGCEFVASLKFKQVPWPLFVFLPAFLLSWRELSEWFGQSALL